MTSKFLTRIAGSQRCPCQAGQLGRGVIFAGEAAQNRTSAEDRRGDWGRWASWAGRRQEPSVWGSEAETSQKNLRASEDRCGGQVSSWRAAPARASDGSRGLTLTDTLTLPCVGSLGSRTPKLAPGHFSKVCARVCVVCLCVWCVCVCVVLYPRAGNSWATWEGTLEVIYGGLSSPVSEDTWFPLSAF